MPATLTGATPSLVDDNGGVRITIAGTFVPGRAYLTFVGSDETGQPCYSGVAGQANLCIAPTASSIQACLPEVAPGDVPLCVVDTTDQSAATLSGVIRAESPFLDAMVYTLRSDIRPTLATGETDPSQLPDAVPVPGFGT